MWIHALDTLRRIARSPAPWVLLGLGVLAGWVGLALSVLAIDDPLAQAPGIMTTTCQGTAVVAALWFLARHLEQDARSGLRVAADCTAPGASGRRLGRWAGATLAGVLLGAMVHAALAILVGTVGEAPLSLHVASLQAAALAAGWGLALAAVGEGGSVVLAGLLAWGLGHLPWGTPGLLGGAVGDALAALLPGPREPSQALRALPATAAATAGLLLLVAPRPPRPAASG